jgi:DNA-3-methyladenine glycosylase
MRLLPRSFFESDALTVARNLLGKVVRKGGCEGIIVEVEAYAGDEASHAFKKPNQGRAMRETYGEWYVYFTYGMHYCANVTCDKNGMGGVLIRAVQPTEGIGQMKKRRGNSDIDRLSTGPACFTEAFGIGKNDNGQRLTKDFGIFDAPKISEELVGVSPRIGIKAATDLPWRFYIKG